MFFVIYLSINQQPRDADVTSPQPVRTPVETVETPGPHNTTIVQAKDA